MNFSLAFIFLKTSDANALPLNLDTSGNQDILLCHIA